MEGVHGVDVSWLHHHAMKNDNRKAKPSSKSGPRAPSPPAPVPKPLQDRKIDSTLQHEGLVSQTPSVPISTTSTQKQQKRGLIHRASPEKATGNSSPASVEDSKPSSRPTWMRSLSSKFSSQSQSLSQPSRSPPNPSAQFSPGELQAPAANDNASSPGPSAGPVDSAVEAEEVEPYTQQSPKSGGSFLSSAFRRLSPTGPGNAYKTLASGSTCPRRVLNVDKERQRCMIQNLDDTKLRRVAFSVDVEVAGVSRYIEESASINQSSKLQDRKLQARSEGEALKRSNDGHQDGERASVLGGAAEEQKRPSRNSVDDILEDEMMAAARRHDTDSNHRKRQEKEDKRKTFVREESNASPNQAQYQSKAPIDGDSESRRDTPGSSLDRPTTDPLRMYRRCCQLRESPVLKRISEQLSLMKPEVEKTGYVPSLDLCGSRMQLTDVICLGDWLAIVPVRKLLIDNANLSNEGLRVILAGLLAAKPPEPDKRKRGKSCPTRRREQNIRRPRGVVEKLSLRMNTKITADGWKHICVFLNLSRSIKAIDLSLIPFPKSQEQPSFIDGQPSSSTSNKAPQRMADLMHESLSQRDDSFQLEEFILSDCNLATYDIMMITDAVAQAGISRLGLAKNQLGPEDLQYVKRYVQSGICKGLDLGGNDLRDGLAVLASAVSDQDTLWALSIADCNLDHAALATLLPALTSLSNFRFLDLSHNCSLCRDSVDTITMLRKYLPRLQYLRRLHLADVSMTLPQAIAIAEILPDIRNINHVSLLENPELRQLSSPSSASAQEDACALYASLMVAVRISKTLLAVDIEVPSSDANEVVQALAKQVVAYAFRNMDRYTSVDAINLQDPAGAIPDTLEQGKEVSVPDVLAHLVGGIDGEYMEPTLDQSSERDYTIGSEGVVKALSYVLGQQGSDANRKSSAAAINDMAASKAMAPARKSKAGDMSKGLLASARQIRVKIVAQLAAAEESQPDDELAYRRLQYLDATLEGMIKRFENTYPDCAQPHFATTPYPFRTAAEHQDGSFTNPSEIGPEPVDPSTTPPRSPIQSRPSSTISQPSSTSFESASHPIGLAQTAGDSRRGSVVNLAARAQSIEEGNMHRFGSRVRRTVLPPRGTDDHLHRTSVADTAEEPYLAELRHQLEALGGDEIREQVLREGIAASIKDIEGRGEQLRIDGPRRKQPYEGGMRENGSSAT